MTLEERRTLLRIARDAVASALGGCAYDPPPTSVALRAPAGAFVTLHTGGQLRGCIGQIEAREPVDAVVAQCAVSAALRDPRFPPLSSTELASTTEIEISVLTPMQKVESIEEIEIGRDGLLIRQGFASGLLLPQVATEWGWDRETFLAQACRKAGLAPDAWRHGAELYRFQAEIFNERDAT
jgi:AmmeMemoRadiSam system protein A